MSASGFPSLVQLFFADRLRTQLGASPHTIAAYRDTFRLLLRFASKHLRRAPSQLRTEDIDAPFLGTFLEHLEITRGNSARTRNNRLAALHAFFRYVAVSEPGLALHCQRVLAIPSKRYDSGPVAFLTEEETAALVAAPDPKTWIGKRDRTLLLIAVSDRAPQQRDHVTSAPRRGTWDGSSCPLSRERSQDAMYAPPSGRRQGSEGMDVTTRRKAGRSCVPEFQRRASQRRRLAAACSAAHCHGTSALSLTGLQNSHATLRHGAAMAMLHRGVDLSVIALWLGHESTETTQIYLHADMQLKERALAHASPSGLKPASFRPKDTLLAFLESL